MKIIAILTIKNRITFIKKVLSSIETQTRKPDKIIIVTDSTEENIKLEQEIISNHKIEYIKDIYSHNYAGSLNSAMNFILKNCINNIDEIQDIYIATIDDDDLWHLDYLEKSEKAIKNNEDFVVSGIIYKNEEGQKYLSIPNNLTIHSFLQKNPHIQGSNTFVKFTTLLKAGLFDENLSSTTDRDIFTRIMMLNPKFVIINEYLTDINAFNDRNRITNSSEKKKEGLKKFYHKYKGFMTEEDKSLFFQRIHDLFNVEKSFIEEQLKNKFNDTPNVT